MRVERLNITEWDDALPSDGFEVFHRPAALAAIDRHAPGELHLYGGFKGQQAIALLPIVVRNGPLGTVAMSPPPGMAIPRLGPIVMPTSPKRRKQEKVNREFTETVLDRIRTDYTGRLAQVGFDSPMAERVGEHLRDRGQTARTVTTKLRYPDFSIRTRSASLAVGTDEGTRIGELACALLDRALRDRPGPLRLVGVGVSGLAEHAQLSLGGV